jgi:hypothetical protein
VNVLPQLCNEEIIAMGRILMFSYYHGMEGVGSSRDELDGFGESTVSFSF